MDNRQQARELWEQSGGTLPLKDIAAQLGIAEGTIRQWKRRDGWGKVSETLHALRTDEVQSVTQRRRRAQVNRKATESVEANEELTDREKEFCIAFVHAPNPSQAAMKTGRYTSYGAARTAAWDMMQKPAVVEEIKRLKAMKRAAMLADGDDVVEIHMRIAFADITGFVEFGREEAVIGLQIDPNTGEGIPVTKLVNSVRFKEHGEVDGTIIAEVKQGRDGASVKLTDRQKSLDFLERFFELNPMDRHKKAYDKARLKLEQEKLKIGNEEALEKLDGILSGVEKVMQDD